MLILSILVITEHYQDTLRGREPLCIGLVVLLICVSMGFKSSYPMNPARDLGPRLFTAVAGWGMDVFRYLPLYLVQSKRGMRSSRPWLSVDPLPAQLCVGVSPGFSWPWLRAFNPAASLRCRTSVCRGRRVQALVDT